MILEIKWEIYNERVKLSECCNNYRPICPQHQSSEIHKNKQECKEKQTIWQKQFMSSLPSPIMDRTSKQTINKVNGNLEHYMQNSLMDIYRKFHPTTSGYTFV